MRSCGSTLTAALVIGATCSLLAAAPSGPAATYRQVLQRETTLRNELDAAATGAPRALLPRIRTLVNDYERLAKKYPTSGYSDNALWQGARLSADAYTLFAQALDRRMARHLLDELAARFPASSLVARIAAVRTRLDEPTRKSSAPSPVSRGASAGPAAPRPATLTAIQRDVLPDAIRVTLLLERETSFSSQRLDTPSRLVIDLRDTRVSDALKAPVTYTSGGVRGVRAVSQSTGTRLLIDLDRMARYSVYPVYDPYRLVIDVEGATPQRLAAAPVVARPTAPPASRTRVEASHPAMPAEPVVDRATVSDSGRPPVASAVRNPSSRTSLSRQLGLGAARIVIDPGHGGHDPGAQSPGLDEAALVLDVALRLEQLLLKTPGVEVVMTRRTSEYIPLEERTAIANRAGADLFLSIHANASANAAARGIETYFLNFAPNADAEAIATRENAGSGKSMHNLSDIVRAITVNDKVDESRELAMSVQAALYGKLRRTNKLAKSLGVKQAPFQVLVGATMPSVLAEISFITNEQEGTLLKTDKYRDQIASALYDGVIGYQRSLTATKVVATKGAD